MLGLSGMSADQLAAIGGIYVTGVLTALIAMARLLLRAQKEEREGREELVKSYMAAMTKQSDRFIDSSAETRQLIYKIVEQRDRDLQQVMAVVKENAGEMARVASVCESLRTYLIQHQHAANGSSSPPR